MADLQTRYMGIPLKNPIVVGASSLSKTIESIQEIEQAGAGALVLKSLFEEQVQLERLSLDDSLSLYDESFAEAVTYFPPLEHAGARQYLYWIERTRKAVQMPLIASVNAVHDDVWVEWAKNLESTGVNGLELNFYSMPIDPSVSAAEIENREFEAFRKVREAVKIPIAVKLHPYYTNVMNVVSQFSRLGANAVVLFNRFLQSDIQIQEEKEETKLRYSSPQEALLALRWTALLRGRVDAGLVASSGVASSNDAIKLLLAGADAVQMVSAIYRNKPAYIGRVLDEISTWMDSKGYRTIDDFRGKLSKAKMQDPWAYERTQYIKALLGFD